MAVPLLAGGGCHGHRGRPHPPEENHPFRCAGPDYTVGMARGRTAALSAAFVIVAVAIVSAGCGGGSSSALSLDPVAAAATKTQNAGAARIRLDMAFSGHGKSVKMHASGAMDGTSVEMGFKLRSLLGLAGMPRAMKSKLSHGTMQEVALEQDGDYVIYIKVPFLASQLPGGRSWIKLDVSKLGKSAGVDLDKLMSGSQLQPTDLLSALKADGAKVHELGSATIDGTATTHYRVTINMAKALESKGLTSPLLRSAATQMKSIDENVWIGNDGLVRRVAFVYGMPQGGSAQMTMDLYDYGAHVDIATPPSSQAFDMTQLAQQGLPSVTH